MPPDTRLRKAQAQMAVIESDIQHVVDAARDAFEATDAGPRAVKEAVEEIAEVVRDAFWQEIASAQEELREADAEVARVERRQHSLAHEEMV